METRKLGWKEIMIQLSNICFVSWKLEDKRADFVEKNERNPSNHPAPQSCLLSISFIVNTQNEKPIHFLRRVEEMLAARKIAQTQ